MRGRLRKCLTKYRAYFWRDEEERSFEWLLLVLHVHDFLRHSIISILCS